VNISDGFTGDTLYYMSLSILRVLVYCHRRVRLRVQPTPSSEERAEQHGDDKRPSCAYDRAFSVCCPGSLRSSEYPLDSTEGHWGVQGLRLHRVLLPGIRTVFYGDVCWICRRHECTAAYCRKSCCHPGVRARYPWWLWGGRHRWADRCPATRGWSQE